MPYTPLHFIAAPVEVEFDTPPLYEKRPTCPARFTWEEQVYEIEALLNEWRDYGRRGKMAHNMRKSHARAASRRGSWGVGKYYFRIRTDTAQIFDLYYDRAPGGADDRKGSWYLFQELEER